MASLPTVDLLSSSSEEDTEDTVVDASLAELARTAGGRTSGGAQAHAKDSLSARSVTTEPATSPLFRRAALEAHARGESLHTALEVNTPRTWWVFALLCFMTVTALGVAFFGHVEVQARGRGVLHATATALQVRTALSGSVRAVHVKNGDLVREGQLVAAIEASAIEAELHESTEQLEALRRRHARQEEIEAQIEASTLKLMKSRARLGQVRVRSQRRHLARLADQLERLAGLRSKGITSDSDVGAAAGEVDKAELARLALEDQLAASKLEINNLVSSLEERAAERAKEMDDAKAQVRSMSLQLAHSEIRAASSGRIEGVSVRVADVVEAGAVLARIVPLDQPLEATVFVAERDRAFLKRGVVTRLELDSLPAGEFGTLRATVGRISADTASASELDRMLGSAEPQVSMVRVELDVDPASVSEAVRAQLGVGALVTARVPLRERRIIALAFDPIRSWLE